MTLPPDLHGHSLREAARQLQAALREAGVASPEAESAWLLEAATGLSRAEQVLEGERPLDQEEAERLAGWLQRRMAREPLQLVLGVAPFMGLEVQVRRGVLVPRPETERLVELVLDSVREMRRPWLHDVGTGSGAIALALAAALPDAKVTASDVDPTAVLVAGGNAMALGLPLEVWTSDLLMAPEVAQAAAKVDVLVANLPYLPEGDRGSLPPELDYEPPAALYAGEDGLDLAWALAQEAAQLLKPGALLWWELDPRNVDALASRLREQGVWEELETFADLAGRTRFLRARLRQRR